MCAQKKTKKNAEMSYVSQSCKETFLPSYSSVFIWKSMPDVQEQNRIAITMTLFDFFKDKIIALPNVKLVELTNLPRQYLSMKLVFPTAFSSRIRHTHVQKKSSKSESILYI